MFAQEQTAQDKAIQSAYMQIVEKHHKHHGKEEHDKVSKKDVEKVESELEKAADALKEETDSIRSSFERHFKALNDYYDNIYAAVKAGDMDLARAHLSALKGYSVKDDKHAGIHDENGHLKESVTRREHLDALNKLYNHLESAETALRAGKTADAHEHVRQARLHMENSHALSPALAPPGVDLKEELVEELTDGDFEARARVASSTKDAELLSSMAKSHMAEAAPGAADILNHIARNPATPKNIIEQLARHTDTKVAATASSMLSAGVHGSKGPTDISPKIEESFEELMEMAAIPMKGAAKVARAFLSGGSAKVGTAQTDGKAYTYHKTDIARHTDDGHVEFNWGGFHTMSTAQHMNTILHTMGANVRVSYAKARDAGEKTFRVNKETGRVV
jgi:hypothetical protein